MANTIAMAGGTQLPLVLPHNVTRQPETSPWCLLFGQKLNVHGMVTFAIYSRSNLFLRIDGRYILELSITSYE